MTEASCRRIKCCEVDSRVSIDTMKEVLTDLRSVWLATQRAICYQPARQGTPSLSQGMAATDCQSGRGGVRVRIGVLGMVLEVLGAQEAHLAKPPIATLIPRQDRMCQYASTVVRRYVLRAACLGPFSPIPAPRAACARNRPR